MVMIMEITKHTFKGTKTGPHLLVFGAIHGNEICGTLAIQKVMEDLRQNQLTLKAGQVTFVPCCNPLSYANNVRFTDEDLNRIIKKHPQAKSYESQAANCLTRYIDDCDILLDLHSMGSPCEPCIFIDHPHPTLTAIAKAINPPDILLEWEKVYPDSEHCQSTETYAHSQGKMGLTVECGQHTDPQATHFAYNAIIQTMRTLEMLQGAPQPSNAPQNFYRFTHLFFRQEGAEFAQKWRNLQFVEKGTLIGHDDQQQYTAPSDCFITMPVHQGKVGKEWFYLTEKVTETDAAFPQS